MKMRACTIVAMIEHTAQHNLTRWAQSRYKKVLCNYLEKPSIPCKSKSSKICGLRIIRTDNVDSRLRRGLNERLGCHVSRMVHTAPVSACAGFTFATLKETK